MADVLSPSQRSHGMSMIRSSFTGPEQRLRDIFIDNGFYAFVMHPNDVAGTPDFYFPEARVAVFVDGCFWHGCRICYKAPESNAKFWSKKIERNVARDRDVNRRLRSEGIKVVRIKEHELAADAAVVCGIIQKSVSQKKKPRVLDLFAGAGGFSEGFVSAGCDMVAHIEMNKDACETIRTRMIYHALRRSGKLGEYRKYASGKKSREALIEENGLQAEAESVIHAEITHENRRALIAEVKKRLAGEALDLIIGGPPCQAYSHIGRSSDRRRMKRDPRKFLYEHYVEFLKALKPRVFVFENVPGLLSAGGGSYLADMRRLMKKAGYNTDYRLLNAADFGVPQDRKRVILIGWRAGSGLDAYPEFKTIERSYTVSDFLSDLPKLKAGEGLERTPHKGKSALLRGLGIERTDMQILLDHVARPQSKRDLEVYKIAVRKKKGGKNLRYYELPKRLKTYKNEHSFLDRFKVVDGSARASHTVIAHIAKDGHYYIHPDIRQNRALTVREAARLQTFPDNFIFEGTRSAKYRQIGNAVPPMLSKIIADELLRRLS
jgi:DNA (cytosine-5)-methyltransferase 1